MAGEARKVSFNEVGEFSRFYLDSYFRDSPVGDVEVILRFLVRELKQLKRRPRMLEVGCGPVLAYALAAAPYIETLDLADYDRGSLQEIWRWKHQVSPFANWAPHTAFVLREEGVSDDLDRQIIEREVLLREKIGDIQFCDLTQPSPLEHPNIYPAVSCFYTTEQAARDREEWERVVGHLANLVQPGGDLFMCFVHGSDNYCIYDDKKNKLRLEIPTLYEEDIRRVLPPLGFPESCACIETQAFGGLEDEGLSKVVLVHAIRADA